MVVQPLCRQHLGQVALFPAALLQLGPLVLEPDLDLRLVQSEVIGEAAPALLVEVPVLVKLLAQACQLLRREGRPGSLLLRVAGGRPLALLDLSGPRSCKRGRRFKKNVNSIMARQTGPFCFGRRKASERLIRGGCVRDKWPRLLEPSPPPPDKGRGGEGRGRETSKLGKERERSPCSFSFPD